jgi:Rieske Fe-S protein
VVLADQNVVVTLGSDSTVHAFSATCTHQGCTVSAVRDGVITCPCHGSRFDARTGAVVTGPAPRALPPVPVVVRDGAVYAG